jgi:hypothetical protein
MNELSERNGKPDRKAGTQSHGTHRVSRATETKGTVMLITTKILGALAVSGLVAAGGAAFTGTGVTNSAGSNQFVGGTVSQGVTGATLSGVVYAFGDAPANTAVHAVALTFADVNSDGKTPTVVFTGGNAVAFTCDVIAVSTHLSTCTTAGADRVGVTSLAITIPAG